MKMRMGIDVGGTKLSLVVLDETGQVCYRQRCVSPNQPLAQSAADLATQYAAFLDTLVQMVAAAQSALGAHQYRLGLGTPGSLTPAGTIKNANSLCLNGRAFLRDLQQRLNGVGLGLESVRLANDANCFALSEATDGAGCWAGQTPEVVFGVILGTGVGGGVVVRGQVLQGAHGVAGEWGHNALPWPDASEHEGPHCYCGKQGCIEAWLSGPALAADYFRASGQAKSAHAIAAMAAEQTANGSADTPELQAFDRYHRRLAKSLAMVINVLDPDVIVLGGGLSNVASLYSEVPKLWSSWIFSDHVHTRLCPPKHGDDSGVRGAAWL